MKLSKVLGSLLVGLTLYTVVMSIPDIKRYIRISMM